LIILQAVKPRCIKSLVRFYELSKVTNVPVAFELFFPPYVNNQDLTLILPAPFAWPVELEIRARTKDKRISSTD